MRAPTETRFKRKSPPHSGNKKSREPCLGNVGTPYEADGPFDDSDEAGSYMTGLTVASSASS